MASFSTRFASCPNRRRSTWLLGALHRLLAPAAGFLLMVAITCPVAAQLRAATAGQLEPAVGPSEEVVFEAGLVPALLGAHLGQPVRVDAWPVAPGVREAVDLTRFDVYAPDAKVFGFRNGRPFEVVEIPMPGVVEHDGQRLPATYVNFYFVNGALLVPTYRHKKNDRRAIEILQKHLPKHEVIGIDCTELIWGLGAIHCLTQQQPKFDAPGASRKNSRLRR